jgi:uncharacterized membrane protein YdjX (TVP38/TMEM64 family)
MKKNLPLLKPTLLLGGFALLILALYTTGCFEYFKWSVWKEIHIDIKQFVISNLWISLLLAVSFYTLAILTFLPGLLMLDLLVGYMFPAMIAILVVATSAVAGAMLIVWGCRLGFKSYFLNNDNKFFKKVQKGFSENETMYLLFLRFMPLFPFSLVTAAVSTLPVSYKKIAVTTFVGMLPIALVLTSVGRSFGDLIELDTMPGFSQVVSTEMLVGFALLSLVSILPVLFKRFVKS